MQTYNYKLYNKANTFKKVINPNIIQSDISFNAQKNWWQGDLSISLNWFDSTIKHSDIIRVFYSSKIVKNKLLYTGYIEEIEQLLDNWERTLITAIWLWSYLTKILFQSWWLRTFTLNKPASEIITDIANYITTINPLIWAWTIETTIWDVSIAFDNEDCFRAIEKIVNLTPDYYFYIDENWKINFKENTEIPDYFITFQKDLQSYENNATATIFNKLYLTYDWWSKTYEDTASINEYWIFEKEITDFTIKNLTTADKFALQYFEENAQPKQSRSLQINRQFKWYKSEIILMWNTEILWGNETLTFTWEINTEYWFEIIQPWEYIRILNFKEEIVWQIEKLDFKKDYIKLILNKNYNFIQLIKE